MLGGAVGAGPRAVGELCLCGVPQRDDLRPTGPRALMRMWHDGGYEMTRLGNGERAERTVWRDAQGSEGSGHRACRSVAECMLIRAARKALERENGGC